MANGGGGTPVYDDSGRRRTQYFEEQFKNGVGSAGRDKVHRSSPIIAELKTNVIVRVPKGRNMEGATDHVDGNDRADVLKRSKTNSHW